MLISAMMSLLIGVAAKCSRCCYSVISSSSVGACLASDRPGTRPALRAGSLAGQAPTCGALAFCAITQRGDGRQFLAFDKLKEGATAGGNIGNAVGDAVLVHCCQRIATASNGKGIALGNRFGHLARAFTELVELEHANRAVPDDGACFLHQCSKNVRRFRADIE